MPINEYESTSIMNETAVFPGGIPVMIAGIPVRKSFQYGSIDGALILWSGESL
jgi:hypothetical protein